MKEKIYKMLKEKAVMKKRKIVIAEGWDEKCLEAASIVLKDDVMDIILLGNPEEIKKKADELKYDISKAEIVDYKNYDLKELADAMVELRKHKGLTKDEAIKLLADENYFACMFVHCGHADALAGSKICPTAALMRPTLQLLREKGKLVSEVMVVYIPKIDRVVFVTDGSLNIDPSPEDLAQMGINAAEMANAIGIEPKVAFLSFSTYGSGGNHENIEKVRGAVKIAKKNSNFLFDGEMQFDAAVNPSAAEKKCPESPLKGEANVLVFPDLNAGNIFIHTVFQITDLEVLFTLTPGLRKHVAILGRSSPVEYVVNMLYAIAMECNAE